MIDRRHFIAALAGGALAQLQPIRDSAEDIQNAARELQKRFMAGLRENLTVTCEPVRRNGKQFELMAQVSIKPEYLKQFYRELDELRERIKRCA